MWTREAHTAKTKKKKITSARTIFALMVFVVPHVIPHTILFLLLLLLLVPHNILSRVYCSIQIQQQAYCHSACTKRCFMFRSCHEFYEFSSLCQTYPSTQRSIHITQFILTLTHTHTSTYVRTHSPSDKCTNFTSKILDGKTHHFKQKHSEREADTHTHTQCMYANQLTRSTATKEHSNQTPNRCSFE